MSWWSNSIGNDTNEKRSLQETCRKTRSRTAIDDDDSTKDNRAGDNEAELL